jgi:DNA polymerase-3 subunit gamma/tau
MTYQVLARKWRPQRFAELIGQRPIVTALQNALGEGRIAQAYLFSGIRGVGKTTAARLLAKSLNCERGPTPEPCNECAPCREITQGGDLDVLEVDAATYSKVEQVRELTESLKYGPARDRYKVAVLDEVHRLSRQAFDALLKIVEEPPRHLVFVFATTEVESVPATILSRCQEFHFRRVPSPELAAHLRGICDAEGIAAGDAALRLVARAGEGSVRDAVALLDQLATFGSGAISDQDAARLTGGLDLAFLASLLAAILAGRSAEIARLVAGLEEEGWDPRHAYNQFLAYCRDALHLALRGDRGEGDDAAGVDLPAEEAAALARTARAAGYENLLRLVQQLLASETTVRRSEAAALALEIALLRAAELPKLTRVEELLAGGPLAAPAAAAGRGGGEAPGPPARPRSPDAGAEASAADRGRRRDPGEESPPAADAVRAGGRPGPARRTAAEPRAPAGAAPPPGDGAAPAPRDDDGRWRAFLDEVSQRKASLAEHLRATAGHRFADGRLAIFVSAGDLWLDGALKRPTNREVLDVAVGRVWGEGAGWETREPDGAAAEPPAAEEDDDGGGGAPPLARHRDVADNPAVQAVLELFQGRVETVEERGSATEE